MNAGANGRDITRSQASLFRNPRFLIPRRLGFPPRGNPPFPPPPPVQSPAMNAGVSLRLRSNLFYQKFVMNESPATASLRSATPKKNVPCFSDLHATDFF